MSSFWVAYDCIRNTNRTTTKALKNVPVKCRDRRYKSGYRIEYHRRYVNVPATEEEMGRYKERATGHLYFFLTIMAFVIFEIVKDIIS